MAFLNHEYRGRQFFKNKIYFLGEKCVPTVESNCCVSDEHELDFMFGRDFLLRGVCHAVSRRGLFDR